MKPYRSINPFYAARMKKRPTDGATRSTLGADSIAPSSPISDIRHRLDSAAFSRSILKSLLRQFRPHSVFNPDGFDGVCRDLCDAANIYCWSHGPFQEASSNDVAIPSGCFELAWLRSPVFQDAHDVHHCGDLPRALRDGRCFAAKRFEPLWRQLPRTISLDRYRLLIETCTAAIVPDGKVAILVDDLRDAHAECASLAFRTKRWAFELGLRQHCPDIVRDGSHVGDRPDVAYDRRGLAPLYVCMVFEKPA